MNKPRAPFCGIMTVMTVMTVVMVAAAIPCERAHLWARMCKEGHHRHTVMACFIKHATKAKCESDCGGDGGVTVFFYERRAF